MLSRNIHLSTDLKRIFCIESHRALLSFAISAAGAQQERQQSYCHKPARLDFVTSITSCARSLEMPASDATASMSASKISRPFPLTVVARPRSCQGYSSGYTLAKASMRAWITDKREVL